MAETDEIDKMDVEDEQEQLESEKMITLELERRMQHLKESRDNLSQNPKDYNAHLKVIGALKATEDWKALRRARESMVNMFPIPPQTWLGWINDEISIFGTATEFDSILKLFERAVKDYTGGSVDLWITYLNFVIDNCPQFWTKSQYLQSLKSEEIGRNHTEFVRNLFRKAANAIGHHYTDGYMFWELYREFETQKLAQFASEDKDKTPDIDEIEENSSDDATPPPDASADIVSKRLSAQCAILRKIWRKQIAIPHADIIETYEAYQEWERRLTNQASSDYKDTYQKNKRLLAKFASFEKELSQLPALLSPGYAEMSRLTCWQRYVTRMESMKEVPVDSRKSLYERAILDCFLHEAMWTDYGEWLSKYALKKQMLCVYQRAVRNLPNSSRLWSGLIQANERVETPLSGVEKLFRRFFPDKDEHHSDAAEAATTSSKKKKKKKKKSDKKTTEDKIELQTADDYVAIGFNILDFYRRRCLCAVSDNYEYSPICYESKDDPTSNPAVKGILSWFKRIESLILQNIESSFALQFYDYYTDFLSRFLGDASESRNIWEGFVKARGKDWVVWNGYIDWERIYGSDDPVPPSKRKKKGCVPMDDRPGVLKRGVSNIYQIRKLFTRALTVLTMETGLQYIGEKYIAFERKCGDIQSHQKAQQKVNIGVTMGMNRQRKKGGNNRKRKRDDASFQTHLSEAPTATTAEAAVIQQPMPVRDAYVEPKPPKRQKLNHEPATGHKMHPDRREALTAAATAAAAAAPPPPPLPNDGGDNDTNAGGVGDRTVFILNFRKNCNEEDLRKLLQQYGQIASMRLPWETAHNKKGKKKHQKWKGYGYVEFVHKDNASRCIAQLNGKSFQGKSLSVQRYRIKTSWKNTVYVKGLKRMSEREADECIRKVFNDCGTINEIRLTKNENSDTLKGFAYVELDSLESVGKALLKDKTMYDDRVLEVEQYIDPNKRKKVPTHRESTPEQKTMDVDVDVDAEIDVDAVASNEPISTQPPPGRRSAVSGPPLSFRPRILKAPPKGSAPKSVQLGRETQPHSSESDRFGKDKSNDDIRKMLGL